ncbi:MAG: TraB domain-containing protein [Nanoarchaeota archaeon]|nr:TraB domain-containing protein [Nanoarchaeota archaeon]MBU1704063.1 TraB domain-containing protein [Nanoarchaeota archaeon]
MIYRNLTLIGTSHIARQSLKDVKVAIELGQPDIICLELDIKRYHGIQEKKKGQISLYDIKRVGLKGFLFSLLGAWAEKKLGNMVGVAPGSEMLTAIKLAKKYKKQISLIDQDIEITLKKLSKAISWKERWNFISDIIKAFIFRKNKIEFDLSKVPSKEIIGKLIGEVKQKYPNIYRVLVQERNEIMAKNLAHLMAKNPEKKILAIIGAGHEEEMLELIEKESEPEIKYTYTIS